MLSTSFDCRLQVGSSEAALLQKLSIRPFTYGLVIDCIYDNGAVFDAAVLDLTDADMAVKFSNACANVAAVSLELGFPTLASLPHSIANAFRALVGVVIEGCDTYSFEAADTVKVRHKRETDVGRGVEETLECRGAKFKRGLVRGGRGRSARQALYLGVSAEQGSGREHWGTGLTRAGRVRSLGFSTAAGGGQGE